MEITSIETPALLVEEPVLQKNIDRMQDFVNQQNYTLYPHFKTHKSLKIAEMQYRTGAKGFTVSGLGEAELLIENGYHDIIVAYPVVGNKIEKLFELHKKSLQQVSCIIDNVQAAHDISDRFSGDNEVIDVFIKIDVGLHRCGVLPFSAEAGQLAAEIKELPGLRLKGLLSHAGHAYRAISTQQLQAIAENELVTLSNAAGDFEKITGKLDCISVGATPTAYYYQSTIFPVLFRPGNYVFNDMIQVLLGSATLENCALSVLSTVVSKPASDRLIIDAGKKTLTADTPASGKEKIGFGGILRGLYKKQLNKNLELDFLSEEHGIIHNNTSTQLNIGDLVRIIPIHACTVSNQHDNYYFVQGENVLSKVAVDGRGLST